MTNLPSGIDGMVATGKVSKEDYDRVFLPLLEEARREGRRLRFVYRFGPGFEGFTAGGAVEDAALGLRALRLFDGCAIVSDVEWIREATRLAGFLMPCPVHVYHGEEEGQAIAWLESLPEGPGISHRILPEAEVIVVDVKAPLRAQDFDALAHTADTWLESHQDLHGLVIHTREFPGWESFGGFLKHLRFVRDHHERVRKIAIATDSKLVDFAPEIAQHFVAAEIKSFPFEALEEAIAWAAGPRSAG